MLLSMDDFHPSFVLLKSHICSKCFANNIPRFTQIFRTINFLPRPTLALKRVKKVTF